MDQYAGLISILQQHAQRFFEIWNFQIVISVAVLGFVMSNEGLAARNRMRVNITIVFVLIEPHPTMVERLRPAAAGSSAGTA